VDKTFFRLLLSLVLEQILKTLCRLCNSLIIVEQGGRANKGKTKDKID